MIPKLDRRQPLHFIGAGGIGMSALAGILAERGFTVSGSDPRPSPVLERLRDAGVRVFEEQTAATIAALIAATRFGEPLDPAGEDRLREAGDAPLVVISSAVPAANAELAEARRRGLTVVHRSDVLAALINAQPSIAVAGSHGKTTTSTLIATLLEAVGEDPTAVIGGIVPAFGSNGREGQGRWLVAEADESDGSLVKFRPKLGVLTNVELDHTDHYPDLASLVATLQHFAGGCTTLLANRDCPVLAEHFQAASWWSIERAEGVDFAALPREERGDGTLAIWYEHGVALGSLAVPLAGRHNLSNTVAAMAACRLAGVPFEALSHAVAGLRPPGRRFDCRGLWQDRAIVDDYAHHPSEVAATLAMARLMVESGRSPLPLVPRRLVAVFQPHRYTRTAQFLNAFADALRHADAVLLAPLYAAGETPMAGISSQALAEALRSLAPDLPVAVADSMDALGPLVAERTGPGDLVLAMGAGDVNSLWDRLGALNGGERPSALAA